MSSVHFCSCEAELVHFLCCIHVNPNESPQELLPFNWQILAVKKTAECAGEQVTQLEVELCHVHCPSFYGLKDNDHQKWSIQFDDMNSLNWIDKIMRKCELDVIFWGRLQEIFLGIKKFWDLWSRNVSGITSSVRNVQYPECGFDSHHAFKLSM